jgi:hypothetical protein
MLTPCPPDQRTIIDNKANDTREFLAVEAFALCDSDRRFQSDFRIGATASDVDVQRFARIAFVGVKVELQIC